MISFLNKSKHAVTKKTWNFKTRRHWRTEYGKRLRHETVWRSTRVREIEVEEDEWYLEWVEYSNNFPLEEKTMRATWASQRTEISCAFFSNPVLRFENVTCLLILFSIRFNCTLPLPIFDFPSFFFYLLLFVEKKQRVEFKSLDCVIKRTKKGKDPWNWAAERKRNGVWIAVVYSILVV